MQLKSYQIRYSILVNGDEYPNTITILGIDQSDAETNLKSRFSQNPDVELVIKEVIAI
jgi:hypothetical protein